MLPLTSLKTAVLSAAVTVIACCGLLTASAGAAPVVNGDFESGNLSGWQVYNSTNNGTWLAYAGDKTPFGEQPFFAPPQGNWAAISDEESPDTAILYQDVALQPYAQNLLTMTLYYVSHDPIFVPTPNTLAVSGVAAIQNQQLRVDVVKTTAPIESLVPGDVLATVFANKNGDPATMAPTQFSADLSAFAGQTVRLRIANAVNDNVFNAAVDAVSIASTPINTFTKGKLKKGNGSATLSVTVPGPGKLSLISVGKKGKPKPIKAVTKNPTLPGTIKLPLKATGSGQKVLKEKGKLSFKVKVSYTPTGGTPTSQTLSGKLNLKLKR
jgi:hypothetical protein